MDDDLISVNQSFKVRLFGTSGHFVEWSNVVQTYPHRAPTSEDLLQIFAEGRPAVLALADRVTPSEIALAGADADVTVVIADPCAASGHRGSGDLIAELWRHFPAIAVLLGHSLLEAGAVAFNTSPLVTANPAPAAADPLMSVVMSMFVRGYTLGSVVPAGDSAATPPADPPALSPDRPSRSPWLADLIDAAAGRLPGGHISSPPDAAAVHAGLLLWHDLLDESHAVAQSIEGRGLRGAGDYWHAIMHRREPDYGNAKYWFRRIGVQPVFAALAARAPGLVADGGETGRQLFRRVVPGGVWNPLAFIDACAEAERAGDPETDRLLRRLQADEILLLLLQTCRDTSD